jgi:hypothetical protein
MNIAEDRARHLSTSAAFPQTPSHAMHVRRWLPRVFIVVEMLGWRGINLRGEESTQRVCRVPLSGDGSGT